MSTQSIIKRSIFCATLFGLAWLVPAGCAQTSYPVARANIPFAFQYSLGSLPAGVYTLSMNSAGMMSMTGASGTLTGLVRRSDGDRQPTTGKLVFLHQGAEYRLEQIWSPERNIHLMCPQPRHKVVKRPEVASVAEVRPVEVAIAETAR